MGIKVQPDGSLRYVEDQARPEIDYTGLEASVPKAVPQAKTTPAQRPPINFTALQEKPPIDFTALDEKWALQNETGGWLSGIFSQNFSASGATIMESWLDLPTRVEVTDDNGDFMAPWDWKLKTPSQYVNMSEEQWDATPNEEKRRLITNKTREEAAKVTGANMDSAGFLVGELVGMLTDPTTALPVAVGTSVPARVATGAAIGAADMAAYETATEGMPTASGVIIGGALGGTLGGFTRVGKTMGHKDPKIRTRAQKKLTDLAEAVNTKITSGKYNPEQALTATMKEFRLNQEGYDVLIRDAGHWSTRYQKINKGERGLIDSIIEPVSVRIKELSEPMWFAMQNTFRKIMEDNKKYEVMADYFVKRATVGLRSMAHKDVYKELKTAMLIGSKARFNKALEKVGKIDTRIAKDYELYKQAMDELWELLSKARKGKSTPLGAKAEVYLHRAVKDIKGMRNWIENNWGKAELNRLEQIVKKQYPNGATDGQLGKIYRDFLSGFYDAKGVYKQPKGSKYRRLTEKHFDADPHLVDLFEDPAKATHTYIKETLDDVYKKNFFGRAVVEEFGDEMGGVGMWEAVAKQYGIKAETAELEELKALLNSVFIKGVKSPHKAIRDFKQITYAGLLGNPISAVTQIGDIFLAAAKYGPMATMEGIFKTTLGRGLSPKEMGLMESMLEEFVGSGIPHKILEKALKWGGFKSVDQLGKAVNLTSAFARAKRLSKTGKGVIALRSKWGRAFGKDFDNLVADLRKGLVTERTKALAFAELADIQPITIMEMPKAYLDIPNGRIWYMLKTFQLKFFNLLREHFIAELGRGNTIPAIKTGTALMSMYVLGGVSTDAIKNFILGRDTYAADAFFDHTIRGLLAPLGIDRYSAQKIFTSSDPFPKIAENAVPPIGYYSPQLATIFKASKALANGEGLHMEDMNWEKWVNQIPIIGKIYVNYLMDGADDWNMKRFKEHT